MNNFLQCYFSDSMVDPLKVDHCPLST